MRKELVFRDIFDFGEFFPAVNQVVFRLFLEFGKSAMPFFRELSSFLGRRIADWILVRSHFLFIRKYHT
jgi:hypothetical protein